MHSANSDLLTLHLLHSLHTLLAQELRPIALSPVQLEGGGYLHVVASETAGLQLRAAGQRLVRGGSLMVWDSLVPLVPESLGEGVVVYLELGEVGVLVGRHRHKGGLVKSQDCVSGIVCRPHYDLHHILVHCMQQDL